MLSWLKTQTTLFSEKKNPLLDFPIWINDLISFQGSALRRFVISYVISSYFFKICLILPFIPISFILFFCTFIHIWATLQLIYFFSLMFHPTQVHPTNSSLYILVPLHQNPALKASAFSQIVRWLRWGWRISTTPCPRSPVPWWHLLILSDKTPSPNRSVLRSWTTSKLSPVLVHLPGLDFLLPTCWCPSFPSIPNPDSDPSMEKSWNTVAPFTRLSWSLMPFTMCRVTDVWYRWSHNVIFTGLLYVPLISLFHDVGLCLHITWKYSNLCIWDHTTVPERISRLWDWKIPGLIHFIRSFAECQFMYQEERAPSLLVFSRKNNV